MTPLLLLALLADPLADYKRERAAAAGPAAEVATADALAAQAEAAAAAGDREAADRFAREARWLLPARPAGLPPHVRRVIGAGRLRHGGRVNAIAAFPDSSAVASASEDGTVRVWDLGNGRERLVYRGHGGAANRLKAAAVAVAPDGTRVASAGGPDIHLWDAATGELKQTLSGGHEAAVRGLAFAPDGTLVAGDDAGRVLLWDVAAGKPRHALPTQAMRVEGVAVDAAGKHLASVNAAGELAIFDLADPKRGPLAVTNRQEAAGLQLFAVAFAGPNLLVGGADKGSPRVYAGPGGGTAPGGSLRQLAGHPDAVPAVAASRDGRLLVTGGRDGLVRLWPGDAAKPGREIQAHPAGVTALAVTPDGKHVISGGEDGSLRVWPTADADVHRAVPQPGPAFAAALSPDGKRLAAGGADGVVRLADPATGKVTKELAGHTGGVAALCFAGPSRLASGGGDKVVKLWDIEAGTATDLAGHTSTVLALAVDGDRLLSGSADGTVRGWGLPAGKPLWTWAGKSAVCGLAVLPDKQLAVGTADGALVLLDTAGGPKVLGDTAAHQRGTLGVAARADGSLVATAGGDGSVRLWRASAAGPVPAGKLDPPADGGGLPPAAACVAFAPDGRQLAAGTAAGLVRVWDTATLAERRVLRGHADWVTAVAFAPDGGAVAAAGADKTVRVFPLPRGDGRPPAHAGPVTAVALGRDGTLATGSDDQTVKLWDPATGAERATLAGPAGGVTGVGFAPGGRVVVAAADGKVRWFDRAGAELRSRPAGRTFVLGVAADGAVVAGWTPADGDDKLVGFDRFPAGDGSPAQVFDRRPGFACAAVAADAGLAAVGGPDGTVRLWNLRTGEPAGGEWVLGDRPLADVQLTPDGKTIVALDAAGTATVAAIDGRAVRATVAAGGGAGVVAGADRFAVYAADGRVTAWTLDGKELRRWPLPGPVTAAAFAADGKTLAVGNADGTAYLLDVP